MTRQRRFAALILDTSRRTRIIRLLCAAVLATTVLAQAQTYTVLHYFTGGGDGGEPVAGLTMAGAGSFYGAAAYGGYEENGTVFNLRQVGSGWILTTLYAFQGGYDGAQPEAAPTIGPDGSLYGTTYEGGSGCRGIGCGTVYKLTPPAHFCGSANCPWTKTVVHVFQSSSGTDGAFPGYGKLIFDQAGNLYGTTSSGGTNGLGTVFELTPSNGSWTETILYSFGSIADGYLPYSSVIFDSAGNLYGTTQNGGPNSNGTVYELSPAGSEWTKSILLSFNGGSQSGGPTGGVVMDAQGNLYGSTISNGGTAYQLSPSNGQWNYTLLAGLPAAFEGPLDAPTLDAAGNVYLTSKQALTNGAVVEVTPSDGGWQLNILHAFSGSDGSWPTGGVILDAKGNIYGTTSLGGNGNNGVIFEIMP